MVTSEMYSTAHQARQGRVDAEWCAQTQSRAALPLHMMPLIVAGITSARAEERATARPKSTVTMLKLAVLSQVSARLEVSMRVWGESGQVREDAEARGLARNANSNVGGANAPSGSTCCWSWVLERTSRTTASSGLEARMQSGVLRQLQSRKMLPTTKLWPLGTSLAVELDATTVEKGSPSTRGE